MHPNPPPIPKTSPEEKAGQFINKKGKKDAIKEITQLMYLSEDYSPAVDYWTQVLFYVCEQQEKKSPALIG